MSGCRCDPDDSFAQPLQVFKWMKPLSKFTPKKVGLSDHELIAEARRRAALAGRTELCIWDFPPGPSDTTVERLLRQCGGDTSLPHQTAARSGPPETLAQLSEVLLQWNKAVYSSGGSPPLHVLAAANPSSVLVALGLGDSLEQQLLNLDPQDVEFP